MADPGHDQEDGSIDRSVLDQQKGREVGIHGCDCHFT